MTATPSNTMPRAGEPAPDFTLPASGFQDDTVSLAALRGRPVVLYFYPKDDTPGCTVQACEFRDRWQDVKDTGAVVLGVSPDPVKSHEKFRDKFALPFPLLADTDHKVAEAYGVWGEKSMYGKKYMGVHRTTFVIAPDGRIARVFEKVKPEGHASEVLEALKQGLGTRD
ncbi:MAG TPA: thioredoxin-dependent thiol peroxidase [Gemmatimonadales bacterium]|nr:thioredoxin-dependent thiol peroxidase [Gemmatimonadales bacterium]